MTLLELMVAIALLSIVSGMLYGLFSGTASSRAEAEQVTATLSEARAVLDTVARDIKGNFPTTPQTSLLPRFFLPPEDTGEVRTGIATVLDLTTVSARGVTTPEGRGLRLAGLPDRGDQARVTYMLTDTGLLYRRVRRPPDPEDNLVAGSPLEEAELLADTVLALEIRGLDSGQWYTDWDSRQLGQSLDRAPGLVEIRLVLDSREPGSGQTGPDRRQPGTEADNEGLLARWSPDDPELRREAALDPAMALPEGSVELILSVNPPLARLRG